MCAAILKGVVCKYGLPDSMASLQVQSYSITSDFQNTQTVQGLDGKTITARYDDRKSVIVVDGVAVLSTIPELGSSFAFTVNTEAAYDGGASNSSFRGIVTKVDDKGSNKNWCMVSITAECYETITYA